MLFLLVQFLDQLESHPISCFLALFACSSFQAKTASVSSSSQMLRKVYNPEAFSCCKSTLQIRRAEILESYFWLTWTRALLLLTATSFTFFMSAKTTLSSSPWESNLVFHFAIVFVFFLIFHQKRKHWRWIIRNFIFTQQTWMNGNSEGRQSKKITWNEMTMMFRSHKKQREFRRRNEWKSINFAPLVHHIAKLFLCSIFGAVAVQRHFHLKWWIYLHFSGLSVLFCHIF